MRNINKHLLVEFKYKLSNIKNIKNNNIRYIEVQNNKIIYIIISHTNFNKNPLYYIIEMKVKLII